MTGEKKKYTRYEELALMIVAIAIGLPYVIAEWVCGQ